MILILLSWIYIFFTAAAFGVAFSKLLRIQQFEIVTTCFLGLFSITVFASVCAFFGPISITFNCILLVLSLLFWYNNKRTFSSVLEDALSKIHSLNFPIKILLVISSFLILAQSATLPFIIDNESYYIQTIKWLNEFGLVKGLANLHLFLGQTSGWHITQSVYSLSFLYESFNDLNGFCLLLANLFAFQKLSSFFNSGNRLDLAFGLLPLTYIFLFQFVSSPSPDMPVYIFGFLMFSNYMQNANKKDNFLIISTLCIYAVYIKITAVALILLPFALLLSHFRTIKKEFVKVMLIGSFLFILFISKNTILTGYPLFPLLTFRVDFLDYTVPSVIMDFFFSKSMLHSFYISNSEFDKMSILEIIRAYLFGNRILGYVALLSLLTLIIAPILIIRRMVSRKIWIIYFAFIAEILLLVFSSPQYRFYIHFTLFFLLLIASTLISKQRVIIGLLSLSMICMLLIVVTPLKIDRLMSNELMAENSTFSLKNLAIPEPNSKWKPEYRGGSVGNMHYHSPIDTSFFWVTGNGKLPSINTVQLDYFHKGFFYIPQQRSIELKNGFYSQKVGVNE